MSMLKCFNDANECINSIQKTLEYNLNVLKGTIVQVYYYTVNINDFIKSKDMFIKRLALEYNGKESWSNQHIDQTGRRSIDFSFPTTTEADQFRKCLSYLPDYWTYIIPHTEGEEMKITDLNVFIDSQTQLLKSLCGRDFIINNTDNCNITIIRV